jgi:hypothetical protein
MRIYLDQVTKKKRFSDRHVNTNPYPPHSVYNEPLAHTMDLFHQFFFSFKRQLYAKQIIKLMSVIFVFVIVSLGVNNYLPRCSMCRFGS